jgi:hypothetical protein
LAPGYRADLAVWPVDGIASSGAWDKVAGLILSPRPRRATFFAKAARLYAILRFPDRCGHDYFCCSISLSRLMETP